MALSCFICSGVSLRMALRSISGVMGFGARRRTIARRSSAGRPLLLVAPPPSIPSSSCRWRSTPSCRRAVSDTWNGLRSAERASALLPKRSLTVYLKLFVSGSKPRTYSSVLSTVVG